MKVIIWLFCFMCAAIVNSLCKSWDAFDVLARSLSDDYHQYAAWYGVLIGICTVATYSAAFYSSAKLSKLYTKHHFNKQVQNSGLSAFQYVRGIAPKEIIEYCENNLDKSAQEITQYLDNQVKFGKLKRLWADVLIRVYSSNCGRQPIEPRPVPPVASSLTQEKQINPQCEDTDNLHSSDSSQLDQDSEDSAYDNKHSDVLPRIRNTISIELALISIIAIVFAMNKQSVKRNTMEAISPSIIYIIMLVLYGCFLASMYISKKQKNAKFQIIFSVVQSLATVIALFEGSVFSKGYHIEAEFYAYAYNEAVSFFNGVYVVSSFALLAMNLPQIFRHIKSQWYSSAIYYDYCYKRVKRMHDYLNEGVISQEEFEKSKTAILRRISGLSREDKE